MPDELKPAGTPLALDAVWHRISNRVAPRPRLCVADEAWLLMQQQAGADFLWLMANPPASTGGGSPWPPRTSATCSAPSSAKHSVEAIGTSDADPSPAPELP